MSEISQLAADLRSAGPEMIPDLIRAFENGGDFMKDQWKANATGTARRHGKHYPKAIESHLISGGGVVAVKVEPNAGMPQGGMSFEYGSRNQPPHLDAFRAFPSADHYIRAAAGRAVDQHIP